MRQASKSAFGNDFVSFREKVKARIGEDRALRYREIEALLALTEYRLEEAKDDLDYGLQRMLHFDSLLGKKPATKALLSAAAPALWGVTRIKTAFRPKAETRLGFSNAFLWSPRYPAVRKQIEEKTGCTALLTFLDTIKIEARGTKELVRQSCRLETGRVKPVYLPCFSVAGGKLQRAAEDYYRLIYRDTFGTESATDAELDDVLPRLRDAYTRREAWLAGKLRKSGLRLYMTVNQYHLRDLLIIHACRDAGIRTVQQEHHAAEFSPQQFDPERPAQRLSLVNHYGLWSEAEKRFHAKVFRYDNMLYPEGENRYLVTGNTEMTYEQARAYQAQYPAERRLIFMSAGIEESAFRSPEELEAYEKWRMDLFAGLREFARKQDCAVSVRYRPYKEQYFRKQEIPVLEEWGFRISPSLPENLMEDLCTSTAVMSTNSSVLATARLLGKTIFRMEDPRIRYIHVDDSVYEVRIADLPELTLPEETGKAEIDPAGFFDIERLIRMPD